MAGQGGRGPSNVLGGIVVTLKFAGLLRNPYQRCFQRRAFEKKRKENPYGY
jgi:hypothetical protein